MPKNFAFLDTHAFSNTDSNSDSHFQPLAHCHTGCHTYCIANPHHHSNRITDPECNTNSISNTRIWR
jgi:hypothetical protein